MGSGSFADIDPVCIAAGKIEYLGGYQAVVNDYIGALK
jgi:hypothetical protein